MPERFQVGDKVRVILDLGQAGPPLGAEGVIAEALDASNDLPFLVDFAPHWNGGHEGVDLTLPGPTGWYVDHDSIEAAETKPFYLVAIIDKQEVALTDEPTFATGKEAQAYARNLAEERGYKVQPRRLAAADPEAWREREKQRLSDGTYQPMPAGWDLKPIADHFLHLSTKQHGLVAFTENPDKGTMDRQTPMRVGVYLERFYPQLDQETRKRYIALVDKTEVLHFAATPKDIEKVYRNGPDSCMAHSPGDYNSYCHPVRAYGDSDLQVAYIKNKHDEISGRAVVWPAKKIYGRCYGDEARLVRALEADGYRSGSLTGARIRALWDEDACGWVVPYVDNISYGSLSEDRKWIVLDNAGDIHVQETGGIAEGDDSPEMGTCDYTGERVPEDELIHIEDADEYWCQSAVDNHAVQLDDGNYYRRINCVQLHDGTWVHQDDDNWFTCDISGERHLDEDGHQLADGRWVCDRVFEERGFVCAGNGDNYLDDQGREIDGDWYSFDHLKDNPELEGQAEMPLETTAEAAA